MRKIYELRAAAADSLGASRITEQPVGTSEPISMQVWLYALPQVSIWFVDVFNSTSCSDFHHWKQPIKRRTTRFHEVYT
jgi:hypothetical protein